ncbi:MAG: hypothetical protein NXI30_04350 [bacterium]|nr:hypothetical protein [bacterium]
MGEPVADWDKRMIVLLEMAERFEGDGTTDHAEFCRELAAGVERLRDRLTGAENLFGQACGDYVSVLQRAKRAEARLAWVLKQAERGDGIEAIKGPLGAWINRPILENNGLRDRKRIANGDSYEEAIDLAMARESDE